MLLTIVFLIAAFVVGYFVGANNPLASVKAKIISAAQTAVKKL